MAKAIITIQDGEDGLVNVSCEFDPPMEPDEPPDDVQRAALRALEAIIGDNQVDSYSVDEELIDIDDLDDEDIH